MLRLSGASGRQDKEWVRLAARKILRGATSPAVRLSNDVAALRPYVRDTGCILDKAFREGKKVLLEGTQGVGLSLHHGIYPHVTSRDTTVSGCLSEAGIRRRGPPGTWLSHSRGKLWGIVQATIRAI